MEGSPATMTSRAKVPEFPLPEYRLEGAKRAFSGAIETIPIEIGTVNGRNRKKSCL